MNIRNLNYGDVIMKAISERSTRMQQESVAAHIFAALAHLSERTIYQIFEEIPQKDKNQIVSLLCKENRDRILAAGN